MNKHIHKLKKRKYTNGNHVFFCTLPDCYFKVECAMALGKESICNQCGEPFIMNEYSLKCMKPHCLNCGKIKIKGEDGKKHFINKRSASKEVLQAVAADTTNDLKNRLSGLVKDMSTEDI